MRIVIGAVGRMKAGPERELFDRYAGRAQALGRGLGLHGPDVTAIDESRARSPAERKREETQALAGRHGGGLVVVLDEAGQAFSSEDFAALLVRARTDDAPTLTFLIGGPDGLDRGSLAADRVLSFGAATIPHQLVRVLLAEQIYRAMTIISRHPYHRS